MYAMTSCPLVRRTFATLRIAEFGFLGVRVRQQSRHLRLQSACADDLAQRSVGRQRQQVTRKVESAGAQSALVGVLLHFNRLGRALPQIAEHLVGEMPIFGEEQVHGLAVESPRPGIFRKVGNKVSALLEVLIDRKST